MSEQAPLPFYRPAVGEEEIEAVVATLRSGWLTTGPRVGEFETRMAALAETPHAVALSSATAALHLALEAMGVGPGDEVILPSLTFAACANVVVQLGARPVLADVCADDLCISPADVEHRLSSRTRALMVVHYGGQPCRMDEIERVLAGRDVRVLEDAAHASGAAYRGRPVGGLGDAAAFSFYATKNLTTGEGGMLTTRHAEIAERARQMALHGMDRDAWKRYSAEGSWYYEVTAPGYKYNMTDLQAALGIVQLRRLPELNARRATIAAAYSERLREVEALRLPTARPEVSHVWHLYPVRLLPGALAIDRAELIRRLTGRGIGTSVHFIPLHRHPYYREGWGWSASDFPVTEGAYAGLVSLPIYPSMTDQDVDRVCRAVVDIVREVS